MGICQHSPKLMMCPLAFLGWHTGIKIIRPVAEVFSRNKCQAVDGSGDCFIVGIGIIVFDGMLRFLELPQVRFKISLGGNRAIRINRIVGVNFQRSLIFALPLFELFHEIRFCHGAEFGCYLISQSFNFAGCSFYSLL